MDQTARNNVVELVKEACLVILINILIGLFITILEIGKGFIYNLIFAQCIGLSIFFLVKVALHFGEGHRQFVQYLYVATAIVTGVVSGLILGSFLCNFDGVAFIRENRIFSLKIIIFSLAAGLVVSIFFISRRNLIRASEIAQQEKILRLAQEKETLQAELKTMQAQIEPHFLFNTLSTIHSLIGTDSEKAEEMLLNLTDFLRVTLARTRKTRITLNDELEIVRTYLDIQKTRMGGRLNYHLNIDGELASYPIPPLLIQPLVENSIRHGLEPQVGGGSIEIKARRHDNRVLITVIDDGCGFTDCHTNGVGLTNIQNRLHLFFGESSKLQLEEKQPYGIKAIITMPYE